MAATAQDRFSFAKPNNESIVMQIPKTDEKPKDQSLFFRKPTSKPKKVHLKKSKDVKSLGVSPNHTQIDQEQSSEQSYSFSHSS